MIENKWNQIQGNLILENKILNKSEHGSFSLVYIHRTNNRISRDSIYWKQTEVLQLLLPTPWMSRDLMKLRGTFFMEKYLPCTCNHPLFSDSSPRKGISASFLHYIVTVFPPRFLPKFWLWKKLMACLPSFLGPQETLTTLIHSARDWHTNCSICFGTEEILKASLSLPGFGKALGNDVIKCAEILRQSDYYTISACKVLHCCGVKDKS